TLIHQLHEQCLDPIQQIAKLNDGYFHISTMDRIYDEVQQSPPLSTLLYRFIFTQGDPHFHTLFTRPPAWFSTLAASWEVLVEDRARYQSETTTRRKDRAKLYPPSVSANVVMDQSGP